MNKLPISDEDYAQIEAYLTGRLDAAERGAFEVELEGNARLKAAFEDYKAVIAALAEEEGERAMRKMMQQWAKEAPVVQEDPPDAIDSIPHQAPTSGTRPSKSKIHLVRWGWAIPAAAALALLCWVGIRHFSGTKDTDLFVKYFQTDPRAPYNLGPGEADEGRMAMGAYLQGDYLDADRRFRLAREKAPLDDTLRYFHGITMLALKRADEAISTFQPLTLQPSGFQDMARWYHALALIRIGKESDALPVLQRIQSERSHPMQQQAAELVKEISER